MLYDCLMRIGEPKIIYEDSELLVVDKPAGWVTMRVGTSKERTLQDWVDDFFGKIFSERSGIAHRLDRETSGLLIVAKSVTILTSLMALFKERKIEKKYWALVYGKVEPKEGEIKLPLMRSRQDRKQFIVGTEGKAAVTTYRVIDGFQRREDKRKEDFSLLEIQPKTGRTHQIRVHLKFIGHPIVTDKQYVGKRLWKKSCKWCPRQFLQAFYLKFTHPKSKKIIEIKIPLADDLAKALAFLQNK